MNIKSENVKTNLNLVRLNDVKGSKGEQYVIWHLTLHLYVKNIMSKYF